MIKNIKVKSVSYDLSLGDVYNNLEKIKKEIRLADKERVNILSFPENSLTGSSLYDGFREGSIKKALDFSLREILDFSRDFDLLISISLPIYNRERSYLCNLLIKEGEILSVIKKDRKKLQEEQVFLDDGFEYVEIFNEAYDLDPNQVLSVSGIRIGASLGEDEKGHIPKSLTLKKAGADIIINPNAYVDYALEEERLIDEIKYLSRDLIYISTGANMGESSTDNSYMGLNLIAKDGVVLKKSRYESITLNIPMDISDDYINFHNFDEDIKIEKFPYLPDQSKADAYVRDVLDIGSRALLTRMRKIGIKDTILGLSGGLDSTMALLFLDSAYEMAGFDKSGIHLITMPGLGTSKKTKDNAKRLAASLNLDLEVIDISGASLDHLKAIGHDGKSPDITYENAQARERTQVLFDLANLRNGIVIGTGDLSEIMQGFATFNGDHMSNFALNSSLMKTELRFIIRSYAKMTPNKDLSKVLTDIVDTPISPELKSEDSSKISQKTEDIIGPYELLDFFIYHHLKDNKDPKKIYALAKLAFKDRYSDEVIKKWLVSYFKRFVNSQFKRSTAVDGASITGRSTSPRLGFKIPSDMEYNVYIGSLDEKEN